MVVSDCVGIAKALVIDVWPEPDPGVEITFGFLGRMDGAGNSGTPDESVPSGVQATPPGPITMVSGLD